MATEFICAIRASGGDYGTVATWESATQCDLATAGVTLVFGHSGLVGTVGDGAAVTGATSGATATVVHATATQILLTSISGTFAAGEQVQVDASNYVTLTDAGDSAIVVGELYHDWADGHTSNDVTISGANCSTTNYRVLRAAAADGTQGPSDHGGDPNAGVYLYGIDYSGATLIHGEFHSWVEGIRCVAAGGGNNVALKLKSGAIAHRVIAQASYCSFNLPGFSGSNRVLSNCLSFGGQYGFMHSKLTSTVEKVINCSFFNASTAGVYSDTSTYDSLVKFVNTVSAFSGSYDWPTPSGSYVAGTGGNASSGVGAGPPPGPSPITSVTTADFVDTANDDYRLSDTSQLKDAGVDASAEGFTLDLWGVTRPQGAGWDIGAGEAAAAGTALDLSGGIAAAAALAADAAMLEALAGEAGGLAGLQAAAQLAESLDGVVAALAVLAGEATTGVALDLSGGIAAAAALAADATLLEALAGEAGGLAGLQAAAQLAESLNGVVAALAALAGEATTGTALDLSGGIAAAAALAADAAMRQALAGEAGGLAGLQAAAQLAESLDGAAAALAGLQAAAQLAESLNGVVAALAALAGEATTGVALDLSGGIAAAAALAADAAMRQALAGEAGGLASVLDALCAAEARLIAAVQAAAALSGGARLAETLSGALEALGEASGALLVVGESLGLLTHPRLRNVTTRWRLRQT